MNITLPNIHESKLLQTLIVQKEETKGEKFIQFWPNMQHLLSFLLFSILMMILQQLCERVACKSILNILRWEE